MELLVEQPGASTKSRELDRFLVVAFRHLQNLYSHPARFRLDSFTLLHVVKLAQPCVGELPLLLVKYKLCVISIETGVEVIDNFTRRPLTEQNRDQERVVNEVFHHSQLVMVVTLMFEFFFFRVESAIAVDLCFPVCTFLYYLFQRLSFTDLLNLKCQLFYFLDSLFALFELFLNGLVSCYFS